MIKIYVDFYFGGYKYDYDYFLHSLEDKDNGKFCKITDILKFKMMIAY